MRIGEEEGGRRRRDRRLGGWLVSASVKETWEIRVERACVCEIML